MDIDDICVTISHPFVDGRIPLRDWVRIGPPPQRPHVAPMEASRSATGERLPLSAIPFRYRNTSLSRLMIEVGIIPCPWGGASAILSSESERDFKWYVQEPGAYQRLKSATGKDFGLDEEKWEKWCRSSRGQ
jgi:hypothetical protein